MKKVDSIKSSTRNEKCDIEKSRIGAKHKFFLRRTLSENLPGYQSNEKVETSPNLRKNTTLKTTLSFTFNSLRNRHLLQRKNNAVDVSEQKTQPISLTDTERSLQSRGSGSKKLLTSKTLGKKNLLAGVKWPNTKSANENITTIAAQPAYVVKKSSIRIRNTQFEDQSGQPGGQTPSQAKQKLLITISGRKTEYKSQSNRKDLDSKSHNSKKFICELHKNQRERIISTSVASFHDQEFKSNLIFTVASASNSLSELSDHRRCAVRKISRSTQLEKQTTAEEFFEEDKLQFPPRDLSHERGSRFPRPLSYTVLQKATKDEKLCRIQDFVNGTLAQSYSSGPKPPKNGKSNHIDGDITSFNDIREFKSSPLFHSINSNDSEESNTNDAARRKIEYVGQPTLYTDEEKEILERKRNVFKSQEEISEYSFELDFLSEAQMLSCGDQLTNEAQIMTLEAEKREHLYKILVIGELGTGKTSFIKRYVHQFFSANYRATIGVDFALKVLHWDQNTIVRLQLWDIAGQERFGNMTRVYYKEAVGAFIVFDVTRSSTFDAVNKWKEDLDSKVQLLGGRPIPCLLLANKCDQEKEGIVTNPEKMDEYVKENSFSGWYETSAKENINIEEAARALVSQILLNDKLITAVDTVDSDKFALASANDQSTTSNIKKHCAC